jgi:hypothetical protein
VSRKNLTNRFLNYYHIQREELDRVENYDQMLNLLCDEHLKDFIDWLTELAK